MKAFIRSNDLNEQGSAIEIIALYGDDADVPADAHGAGLTIVNVPSSALVMGTPHQAPKLAANWRERAGPNGAAKMMQAEARRRADEVLPLDRQIEALHEMVSLLAKNGAAKMELWPTAERDRFLVLDQRFKYVQKLHERADTFAEVPVNPSADSHWPTRIKA